MWISTESLKTCLKYLWPLLADGGYFFTHEAPHQEIAAVFFDEDWWHANLHSDALQGWLVPVAELDFSHREGAFEATWDLQ